MSMDKGIAHGKEHRKEWKGRNRSKNFDKTCRNHGSCPYCEANRLFASRKRMAAAQSKEKEDYDMADKYTGYYRVYFDNGESEMFGEVSSTEEYIDVSVEFDGIPTEQQLIDKGIDVTLEANGDSFVILSYDMAAEYKVEEDKQ